MKVVYAVEQKKKAVATYRKLKSYAATIRQLGYPSRHVLFDWVRESGSIGRPKKARLHAAEAISLDDEAGGGRGGYERRERQGRCRRERHDRPCRSVRVGENSPAERPGRTHEQERADRGRRLQDESPAEEEASRRPGRAERAGGKANGRESHARAGARNGKKRPGCIPEKLRPKAKAAIVDSLKARLPLGLLLEVVGLPRSSYCYASLAAKRPDKYAHIRAAIREISEASMHAYGSPRIWPSLRRRDVLVSEKVVRRLMKEEGIEVRYAKRKRRYSSHIGEITPRRRRPR